MRIYELLNEEQTPQFELIAKYLAKNCKPFLNQVDEYVPPLYRGQSFGFTPVCDHLFKSTTKAKREPLDSIKKDHTDADDWFLKQFGIRFRSGHIMFASSDDRKLSYYGKIHIAIPIGNFKFCWSPTVVDLLGLRDSYLEVNLEKIRNKVKYQVDDLEKAMESGNEVMVHCKSYFLLDVKRHEYQQIIKIAKRMVWGKYKPKLEESFDSQVQGTIVRATDSLFTTRATINDRIITVRASSYDDGDKTVWEVLFDSTKDGKTTVKKTGDRGELQVFSFVIETIKELTT